VLGKDHRRAVAKSGLQITDDESIVRQGVEVDSDGPNAPMIMDIPPVIAVRIMKQVALGRLKMVGPQKHAVVPMDCSNRHGGVFSFFFVRLAAGVLEVFSSPP